jgi:hypothetical protein
LIVREEIRDKSAFLPIGVLSPSQALVAAHALACSRVEMI